MESTFSILPAGLAGIDGAPWFILKVMREPDRVLHALFGKGNYRWGV